MKITTIKKLALVSAIAVCSSSVSAKELWSDFSITAMTGADYLEPFSGKEDDRSVVTIEHASGHTWGGTFFFMDRLSNPDEVYGELNINPTLYKPQNSFVKEVFLGLQTEYGSGDTDQNNYLLGGGVSLDVPGFQYFNVAYYRRFQDDIGIEREDNNQITVTWGYNKGNFRYDGFLDIVDSTDTMFGKSEGGFNFTSQLKYNIAPMLGLDTGRLDVGIEYVYWKNKFGVDGQTEHNPNLMVKWHF